VCAARQFTQTTSSYRLMNEIKEEQDEQERQRRLKEEAENDGGDDAYASPPASASVDEDEAPAPSASVLPDRAQKNTSLDEDTFETFDALFDKFDEEEPPPKIPRQTLRRAPSIALAIASEYERAAHFAALAKSGQRPA
jgi:hypothetical protein